MSNKDLFSNLNESMKTITKVALQAVDTGLEEINKAINEKGDYIRVPSAASEYYRKNYEDVFDEFEAYGFKDIVLLEQKDLKVGLFTKEGSIEKISIDGKADFKKNAKFRKDARVVIIYHTYKNEVYL